MTTVRALTACLLLTTTAAVAAQQFEVASVKKSAPPGGQPTMVRAGSRQGDQWLANNATLRMMIRSAYGPLYAMEGTIVGGPSWIDTDRFDVAAKMAPGTTADDMRAMAKAMLAERFKLAVRAEKREVPVYVLLAARSDGRLGSQMKPAGIDCVALRAERKQAGLAPIEARSPGGAMARCTSAYMFGPVSRIESGGMTIAELAGGLSRFTGRPVFDRSGLTGYYVVRLDFASEPGAVSPFGPVVGGPTSADPSLDEPSLFSAIQEQLGLKLEIRNEPMDVLVIDSAQQPTEN